MMLEGMYFVHFLCSVFSNPSPYMFTPLLCMYSSSNAVDNVLSGLKITPRKSSQNVTPTKAKVLGIKRVNLPPRTGRIQKLEDGAVIVPASLFNKKPKTPTKTRASRRRAKGVGGVQNRKSAKYGWVVKPNADEQAKKQQSSAFAQRRKEINSRYIKTPTKKSSSAKKKKKGQRRPSSARARGTPPRKPSVVPSLLLEGVAPVSQRRNEFDTPTKSAAGQIINAVFSKDRLTPQQVKQPQTQPQQPLQQGLVTPVKKTRKKKSSQFEYQHPDWYGGEDESALAQPAVAYKAPTWWSEPAGPEAEAVEVAVYQPPSWLGGKLTPVQTPAGPKVERPNARAAHKTTFSFVDENMPAEPWPPLSTYEHAAKSRAQAVAKAKADWAQAQAETQAQTQVAIVVEDDLQMLDIEQEEEDYEQYSQQYAPEAGAQQSPAQIQAQAAPVQKKPFKPTPVQQVIVPATSYSPATPTHNNWWWDRADEQ
jgi:hypothetical protein